MVGETKQRLAEAIRRKLTAMGHTVEISPTDLRSTHRNRFTDWVSWEGWMHLDGFLVSIFSWDTMDDCARNLGVNIKEKLFIEFYKEERGGREKPEGQGLLDGDLWDQYPEVPCER